MTKKLVEIAFFVDDVAATTAFYRRFLEREPVSAWPGGAIFMLGDVKLFFHEKYEQSADSPLPPVNHLAFHVDHVDETATALVDNGLLLEFEPADYDWGRSAYLRDPAGHQIEITNDTP